MKSGTATWRWSCPDCEGRIVMRRAVNDELDGALLEFEHAEPVCHEFDEGENLAVVIEAWKTGKFVTADPAS